jgi:hypothetical protein
MGGFKLTGLATATALGDALSYGRAATVSALTDSALTSGRVTYASTAGLLADSANLTFDGTTLTAAGLATGGSVTLSGGTANGVAYLNGSKVLTTGSALTFDGSRFAVTTSTPATTPSWLSADTAVLSQTSNSILQLHVGVSGGVTGIGFSTGSTRNAGLISFDTGSPSFIYSLSGTEQMRLTSTGLGIGMSLPSTRLDLGVSSNAGLRIRNGVQNVTSLFYNQTDGSTLIRGATDAGTGFLVFETGVGTERMRIDSSGNLLVGTTTNASNQKVTIVTTGNGQSINTSSSTATVLELDTNSSNTTQVALLVYSQSAAAIRLQVYSNGNVVNTNGSYGAISDVKLKENIVDTTPKLDDLLKVKVRNYNLKSDPDHKQIGVIAQELETVFPAMIDESPDKDAEGNDLGTTTKSVKYSVFVPMLIKAIQEQQAIIEQLTARITTLEAK